MNQVSLPLNTVLSNKYKIIRVIGQGGFGITYLVNHIELQREFALKECYVQQWCARNNCFVYAYEDSKERFEEFKIKFLKEAQTIAKLDNKNIVKVLDYFEENNTAYFVMEYVEGDSLRKIIAREGKLGESNAIELIMKLSGAVEFLHQKKILHRDIKPDNIIIRDDQEPILLDFGAAREMAGTHIPHTVIQTPGYAPIEQYDENSQKGFYIDIYSIGATLYHMLTGQIPIDARQRIVTDNLTPPKLINPEVSDKINEVILKAMSVMYLDRFQSVNDFISVITGPTLNLQSSLSELSESQKSTFRELESFIQSSDSKIFILSGSANTGKSFLIKKLINYLQGINKQGLLLASTSKVAESIRFHNEYEKVTSLYTLIYNFYQSIPITYSSEEISSDESDEETMEKIKYGFKRNHEDPSTIYIVDNAELVSDEYTEFELKIFGSGKLLEDFISYSEIQLKGHNRKIIFVGDDKQLLRGSKNTSSLSEEHLKKTYGLAAKFFKLDEIFKLNEFEVINNNVSSIYNSIENNIFNNLELEFDSEKFNLLTEESFNSEYLSLPPADTIILEHTNKQAKIVNDYVRKLLGRKKYLEEGDRIVLFNGIEATDEFNQTFHFANGEFAEVVTIGEKENHNIYFKRKERKKIELVFTDLRLKFESTDKEANVKIIENFFLSEERDLGLDEIIAINILVNRKFNALENIETYSILKSIAQLKRITDLSEYETKLSLEQKEFRKFLSSKGVLKDIRNYYIRKNEYLNAAKIKFGYCITCHRAQGFKWQNVIVNCENNNPKTNENYFRWFYTAITRSSSKLYLVNPPVIKPTINLKLAGNLNISVDSDVDFYINPENFIKLVSLDGKPGFPQNKPLLAAFYKLVEGSINNKGYEILKVEHKKYQECYHFKFNSIQYELRFIYNGKYQFKKPWGSNPNEKELINLIFSPREMINFPQNFLKEFYQLIKTRLKSKNIDTMSIEHIKNAEVYLLVREEERLISNIYYTAEQFFTSVMLLKANSQKIVKEFKEIIETRLL